MKTRKIVLTVVALGIGIVGFHFVGHSRGISRMSEEARRLLKEHLLPLPAVQYESAIGRVPTVDEVELGRMLFNDPIISRNNDVSCATCHLSNHGFAEGSSLPVGSTGRGGPDGNSVGKRFAEGVLQIDRGCGDDGMGFLCTAPMFRNVPTTINAVYRTNRVTNEGLLWDGRFGDLDFQTVLPIHTPEELCGFNPVPGAESENIFRPGGPLFKEPVHISHSHLSDYQRGVNLNLFNAQPEIIYGVPSYRDNGTATLPTRNECLAIAVAKIRAVPEYRKLFAKAFNEEGVSDLKIGRALAAFVATHVSRNTPYDRFVRGEEALTEEQIKGMVMYMSPLGKKISFSGAELTGAGCVNCHAPPEFGGHEFFSLGVRGDPRSVLSKPRFVFSGSGFLLNIEGQRGSVPSCIREGISIDDSGYVPDIGRANATTQESDCFKFRAPMLRNVIETFPYFHHGMARGQGYSGDNFAERSRFALRQVIEYHLRGPVNHKMINRLNVQKNYFDSLYLKDNLVPVELQDFSKSSEEASFPIQLSNEELEALTEFVAIGLLDPDAVVIGEMGNDISHPRKVPSGFEPSVTRDNGKQVELPPKSDLESTKSK